jgi:L-ribulose-5-phosphate 3-epimerase UlaE
MAGGSMAKEQKNWGRDPAVQRMRKIFAEMDQIQETILNQAGIKPFDSRLRSIRETARDLFDRATARAADKGIRLTDNAMIDIYTGCLQQALTNAGIAITQDLLPDDSTLSELVSEVSR